MTLDSTTLDVYGFGGLLILLTMYWLMQQHLDMMLCYLCNGECGFYVPLNSEFFGTMSSGNLHQIQFDKISFKILIFSDGWMVNLHNSIGKCSKTAHRKYINLLVGEWTGKISVLLMVIHRQGNYGKKNRRCKKIWCGFPSTGKEGLGLVAWNFPY